MIEKNIPLGSNIPVVHSISGSALMKMGWILFGRETKGQSIIAIYKKDEDEIRYDGVHWDYNGERVQFLEDLKQDK